MIQVVALIELGFLKNPAAAIAAVQTALTIYVTHSSCYTTLKEPHTGTLDGILYA